MTDIPRINAYGDDLISTTGRHGAEIASQRMDGLDREALRYLLNDAVLPAAAVDIGCGFGLQGIRFALLGADAFLYDLLPESRIIRMLREDAALTIAYLKVDVRRLRAGDLPADIRLAYSQRFLHYLRYTEAQTLFRLLAERMLAGAMFFISASGLESELGVGYPGAAAPVEARFATLAPSVQAKHEMREPVCLYREGELNNLLGECGFAGRKVWTSSFGNIKGVFQRSV